MKNLYDKLTAETKQLIEINYEFDFGEFQYREVYDDGTTLLIVICPGSMIYVTNTDRSTLDELIENDQIDEYEAYDMVDGSAYYLDSEHALAISEALMAMINLYDDQCPLISTARVIK